MVNLPPPPTLTLPSDAAYQPLARDFVASFCRVHGVEEAATHALVLATGEAFSNVIRHAHRDRTDASVHIECHRGPGRVEIHVLDEGDPFDVADVPHLDPGEVRLGGRGVFLMRQLMDDLRCERRTAGGNRLRLVKFL
jgi:serine/threonine-protein kinase RsbW